MKPIRIVIAVFIIAILGLSWYSALSVFGEDLTEYNKYVAEGDKAFEKTHFQEAYIAYKKALKVKPTVEAQDKILSAYYERYKETDDYTDYDSYVSEYTDACSRFKHESKYYEGAVDLMMSDSRYSEALKIYNQAKKNNVGTEKLNEQYNKIKKTWTISAAGYTEYTEPYKGYFSYRKEIGWCTADTKNYKDLTRGYPYSGRVGDDKIFFTENKRQKSEFVDTNLIVRGKINDKVEAAGIYSEGLIPIKVNGKYKYTDLDGNASFGAYKFAGTFYNSSAPVQLDSGKWTLVDKKGNTVTENQFDSIVLNKWDSCVAGSDKDSMICQKDGAYYVYSADGKKEICKLDCQDFDIVTDDNIFAAKKSGKWGFIDISGKWIIEPEFDEAKSFSSGFAAVCSRENWKLISRSKETVVQGDFVYIGYVNSDGRVMVRTKDENGVERSYYDWLKFSFFDLLTSEG